MQHKRIVKTTVEIPDHLLIEAKQLAAARRLPLARILEESLRAYLAEARAAKLDAPSGADLPVVDGVNPRPGINLDDTSALLDLP